MPAHNCPGKRGGKQVPGPVRHERQLLAHNLYQVDLLASP